MTTSGTVIHAYPIPTNASEPSDITVGPDNASIWFTEQLGNKIGTMPRARHVTKPR